MVFSGFTQAVATKLYSDRTVQFEHVDVRIVSIKNSMNQLENLDTSLFCELDDSQAEALSGGYDGATGRARRRRRRASRQQDTIIREEIGGGLIRESRSEPAPFVPFDPDSPTGPVINEVIFDASGSIARVGPPTHPTRAR